jgi:catechol 2,3-dioxygenase-like lactoylglutathione lyase family enzyme
VPILSIDHVQIAIPINSEDRARAFYSGIFGFAEIAKPPQMAERKSIWFVAGAVNLHLGIERDFTPAKRPHPAFVVEGLDKILAACDRAGISSKPDTSFNGFRRVHVFDPFGNRLELMEPIKP